MSETEKVETWPPPPQVPPPLETAKPRPPARGYSVGFVGIIAFFFTAIGLAAIVAPVLRGIIIGMIGLSLCVVGLVLSIQDIRSSAANNDKDGVLIGGLGIFLNVVILALAYLVALLP